MGCSSDDGVGEPAQEPNPQAGTAIAFSGLLGEEQAESQGARRYEANWANEANGANGTNGANEANGAATRAATPLSEEDVTEFKVWGYKSMSYTTGVYGGNQTVFPGYMVDWVTNSAGTTTSNSNGWEYVGQGADPEEQTIKYWDWGASAYRFFAVTGTFYDSKAAYEAAGSTGVYGTAGNYGPADAYETYGITMKADIAAVATTPYFSSLWFSTGNALYYPTREFGKPVQLEFLKPYSKVRFIFTYAYPREGILLEDKCFKPTADYEAEEEAKVKIATAGTFKVTYPLTGTETREWFGISDITGKIPAFTEDCDPEDDGKEYTETTDGWYTVLPNNTQGSYKLSVDVNKETKTCVVPAEYMQWKPGYSYTYIFKITTEGGVEIDLVQSAVTSWTEMEGTHSVYNW